MSKNRIPYRFLKPREAASPDLADRVIRSMGIPNTPTVRKMVADSMRCGADEETEDVGNKNSGNWGHKGRPGQVGGSGGGGGGASHSAGSPRHKGTERSRTALKKVEKALGEYERIQNPNWGHAGEAAYIRNELEESIGCLPESVQEKLKATAKNYPVFMGDPESSIKNSAKRSREIMSALHSAVEGAEGSPSEHEADFISSAVGGVIIPGRGYAGGVSASENFSALNKANHDQSQICAKKAKEYPAGSHEREVYENYANMLSKPLSGRPTPEQSKALTDKYLSNISNQLQPYAVERYKRDLANEPQITSDLCDISDEIGTGMFGLDFRLKKASDSEDGGCRIADKIADDMHKEGWSYEQATDNLSDMVRYTQACTPNNLVSNYNATMDALKKKGYKPVKVKNTWESYSVDRPYRGVNCVFESPTGTKFELQFHTAESLVGKEVQHGWYEEQRSPRTTQERKTELGERMYKNMSSMATPQDIGKIQKYPPD